MSLLERLGKKPIQKESKQIDGENNEKEVIVNDEKIESVDEFIGFGHKKEVIGQEEIDGGLKAELQRGDTRDNELSSKLELISKLDSDVNLTKALELLSSLSSQLNKNKNIEPLLNENSINNAEQELNKKISHIDSYTGYKSDLNINKTKESGARVVSILSKSAESCMEEKPSKNQYMKNNDDIDAEKENVKLAHDIKNIAVEESAAKTENELNAKATAGMRLGLGSRLGLNTDVCTIPNPTVTQAANAKNIARPILQSNQDQYQSLKIEIHRQIIEELSIEQQKILTNSSSDRSELERIVADLCNKVIDGDNPFAIPRADRANIVNDIIDEVLGLGPIEPLLKDDTVSEVMINGPKMVYVERKGKLSLTSVQFQDEAHLMNIIERIVAPLGRRIDESSPLVDARLADGSRVNVIIPPLALNGACVTIRKFAKDPLTINNLIGFGTLNDDMASLIKACVTGRLNIVVSGGTGSGKTTTLNVLSSFIPEDERIVTIEDAAELQLRQDHVVTLESRPANIEGNGQVAIRDLVRNALRMRPDRIVVGEVRSGEALDMLQAMNTGHDGSLTTAHANSPRDVLSRLETMVLMAGMELPVKAIREQIASAIDLIIQQTRLRDGSRKITYITEVQGMEGDVIVLQDLFYFEQDGLDEDGKLKGTFRTTGIRPKFLEKLETNGIKLDCSMFLGDVGWDE